MASGHKDAAGVSEHVAIKVEAAVDAAVEAAKNALLPPSAADQAPEPEPEPETRLKFHVPGTITQIGVPEVVWLGETLPAAQYDTDEDGNLLIHPAHEDLVRRFGAKRVHDD